jgi:amidase
MEALTQYDPQDPWMVPIAFYGPPENGPTKVAFTKNMFEFELSPAVEAALDEAAEMLSAAGYEIVEIEPPMLREIAHEANKVLFGETIELLGEHIEAYGSETIKSIFKTYGEMFTPYSGRDLQLASAKRSYYVRSWTTFLAEYPLVLTPFLPTPPFRWNRDEEGQEGIREVLGAAIYSYSMNYLGLPAGNIPAHFDKGSGLPIGVQIIGRRFREDMILDACEVIERGAGVMAERLFARAGS